jgi:hypothetical protein
MSRADRLQGLGSGAIVMGYAACALFFLPCWHQTRDRLFLVFSLAFWLLGLQRLALVRTEPAAETRTGLSLVGLLACRLMLAGIGDRNRAPGGQPPQYRASAEST